MQQAIDILDEMIKDLNGIYGKLSEGGELKRPGNAMIGILEEAKSRIQNLQNE